MNLSCHRDVFLGKEEKEVMHHIKQTSIKIVNLHKVICFNIGLLDLTSTRSNTIYYVNDISSSTLQRTYGALPNDHITLH
jgi:hypothetical protein